MFNGIGQAAGFINPILMAWFTDVDETRADYTQAYARGWRKFYFLNGGTALVSIAVVLGGFALKRGEWRRHPSLEPKREIEKRETDGEIMENRSKVYENRCENIELN